MKFTTDFLRMIAPGKWYVATATYDGRYELAKRKETLPFALNTFHIRRVLETSPSNTFLVDLISTKRPGESISLYLDYGDQSIELLPDPIDESKPLQSEGQEKLDRRFRDSVKRYADLSYLSDLWLWGKMIKPCAGIRDREPVFFRRGNEGIRLLSTIRPVVALVTDGDNPVAYKPVPGRRFAFPFNQGRIEQLWLMSSIQVSIQPEELVSVQYKMDGVGPNIEITLTIMAKADELESPDNTVRNGKRRSVARVTVHDDPDGDPRQITAVRVDPDPHGGEREV